MVKFFIGVLEQKMSTTVHLDDLLELLSFFQTQDIVAEIRLSNEAIQSQQPNKHQRVPYSRILFFQHRLVNNRPIALSHEDLHFCMGVIAYRLQVSREALRLSSCIYTSNTVPTQSESPSAFIKGSGEGDDLDLESPEF